jgi:hypothetical protein
MAPHRLPRPSADGCTHSTWRWASTPCTGVLHTPAEAHRPPACAFQEDLNTFRIEDGSEGDGIIDRGGGPSQPHRHRPPPYGSHLFSLSLPLLLLANLSLSPIPALSANILLENPEAETRWYFRYFLGKEHTNFVAQLAGDEPETVLLSVLSATVRSRRRWRRTRLALPHGQR